MASYEQDAANLRRRKTLADALMQQSQQGLQGQSVGGRFVAPSSASTIASILSGIGGGVLSGKVGNEEVALKEQQRSKLAEALRGMSGASAPGAAPDPKREAALAVLQGLPLEAQQAAAGQQAAGQLFPKPTQPEPFTLSPGQQRFDSNGRPVASMPGAPEKEPEAVRTLKALLENPELMAADTARRKAGATSVNVDTKGAGALAVGLGGERSKALSALHAAAQSAPETIQRAERVKTLLQTVPYTGAAADWKLALGKAAKAAGFDYAGDDIANTEMLARELGQNVLDSVKTSGLAGSQGLTEGERKFLLQVVGGTIALDDKSIARVADLNQRMAKNTMERWNAEAGRVEEGNPGLLNTLGMSTIEMPAGTPAPSASPRLKQNPDGSYEYVP
jgi:hypothetical protein